MTPVSQIIWKNRGQFDSAQPLLLVCPAADNLATNLRAEGFEVIALCLSHAVHRHLTAAGIDSHFAITPPQSVSCAQIILFQPREKP